VCYDHSLQRTSSVQFLVSVHLNRMCACPVNTKRNSYLLPLYVYLYTDYTIFEEKNQKYSNLLRRNRNFSISPIHFYASPPPHPQYLTYLSLFLPREYSYRVRQQCLGSHTGGRMNQNTVRLVFKNRKIYLQSLETPKEPDSGFEGHCDSVPWAVGCFHCTGLLLHVRIYWYGLIKC
jgi:hypothetical protein